MKKTLIFPLIFVGLGVACGGDDGARRGNQTAAFETVQEGSAAGVTSTIQGPGEALPPVTGTNADTTTAFSIDPTVASAVPPPNVAPGSGTLAGTMPSQPSYPPPMTSAAPPPQRSYPQPQPQRAYPQPQPQQQPRPVEREQPQPQQPATDTAVTTPQQQPPVTHTNPSPQQQQPPATNTNPPQEEDSEEAEEEPPPPPTTTDTRGN
jgi:hypothetical protein